MQSNAKELTQRQHTLLLAAVQEFIARAEPVGSHHLASRHTLGVRSATVRNLLGELEDAGYLSQPHTSAGRVPTDKAFRYFVDHVTLAIPFEDRAQIELHYSSLPPDLNAVIRDTSRLLALMTGQAALVRAPKLESSMIEQVRFLRLREREVLVIFVAPAGNVQHRLVNAERDYTQSELDRMAAYLKDSLSGRTLEQARGWIEENLRQERARYDDFMRGALLLGEALTQPSGATELYVEGSARAMSQPEFADSSRLRELLQALEDKDALLDLLDRALKQNGPMISIGSENFDVRLAGFSVVAAPYASGASQGSLAVLGPVRMDYERVIPLVSYTAKALSHALGNG
jgi:heat-inducible transcriptional repressor